MVFTGGEAGLSLIDGSNLDDIGAVPPNPSPPPPHSFVVEYLPGIVIGRQSFFLTFFCGFKEGNQLRLILI